MHPFTVNSYRGHYFIVEKNFAPAGFNKRGRIWFDWTYEYSGAIFKMECVFHGHFEFAHLVDIALTRIVCPDACENRPLVPERIPFQDDK